MPTLTDLAPADPHPPRPGPAARAAVAARARRLSRRRRVLQGAGGVAVVAIAVGGVFAVAGGSGSRPAPLPVAGLAPTATVHGHLTLSGGATATVRLTGPGGTYEIAVAPDGQFSLSGVEPGVYSAVATVETPGVEPGGGVSIGSALASGKATLTLQPGDNAITIPLA